MKHIIAITVAFCLTMTLAACGNSSVVETPSNAPSKENVVTTSTPDTKGQAESQPSPTTEPLPTDDGGGLMYDYFKSSETPKPTETPVTQENVSGDFIFKEGQFILPIEEVEKGSVAIPDKETFLKIGNDFNYPMAGKYHLTADIDLSGAEWVPIGTLGDPFNGTFDGQGHIIRGLTITGEYGKGGRSNTFYVGLFGFIADATIKNVALYDNNIDATVYKGMVGGIVGGSQKRGSSIINCYNTVNVSVYFDSYGGAIGAICGEFAGTVESCYNTGKIYGHRKTDMISVGGIIGNGLSAEIANCYNSGDIIAEGGYSSAVG
jgi:hypothetical protein